MNILGSIGQLYTLALLILLLLGAGFALWSFMNYITGSNKKNIIQKSIGGLGMNNNGWLKLAVFSFVGILTSIVILGFISARNPSGTDIHQQHQQGNMNMQNTMQQNGMNGNMGMMNGGMMQNNTMMMHQLNQMQMQLNQMQQQMGMMNGGMGGMNNMGNMQMQQGGMGNMGMMNGMMGGMGMMNMGSMGSMPQSNGGMSMPQNGNSGSMSGMGMM